MTPEQLENLRTLADQCGRIEDEALALRKGIGECSCAHRGTCEACIVDSARDHLVGFRFDVGRLGKVTPCSQCGADVEPGREDYAWPMCHACLAPPAPLPVVPVHADEKRDGVRVCTRCGIVWSPTRKRCRGVLPAVETR